MKEQPSDHSWQRILSYASRIRNTFAMLKDADPDKGISLYGAGLTGLEAAGYLRENNRRINCFIDSSIEKQGTFVSGIPVVSLDHPLAESSAAVIITIRTSIRDIGALLEASGYRWLSYPQYFVLDNLETYETVRNNLLSDELSRTTLDGLLSAMLTGNLGFCTEVMDNNQYFCLSHFQDIGEEFFVDAGAYVGDTIERFIWANTGLFRHIHLFEPGARQFKALQFRMARLIDEWALDTERISLVNAGLSEQDGRARTNNSSFKLAATSVICDHTSMHEDMNDVEILSLDSYLDQHSSPVSFIKADVEGMELKMLRGAARSIILHKPKLAISVYHNLSDLFNVIDLVKSFVPSYKVSLRHHSSNLSETVLYCWVEDCEMER